MDNNKNVTNPPKTVAPSSSNSSKRARPTKTRRHQIRLLNQERQNNSKEKMQKIDHDEYIKDFLRKIIVTNLSACPEGEEINMLCQLLQPDAETMYNKFYRIKIDIIRALKCLNIDDFSIHPFGSSVSGLAFKDSDFDFYIKIHKFCTGDEKTIIHKMTSAMGRCRSFEKLTPIVHARIPIIKCMHIETASWCDINFTNPIGILNSSIIKQITNFDQRIHPLFITLKLWMRLNWISGRSRISNYCIILLIIVYLQTIDVPVLPALRDFQNDVAPYIVDGWNLAWNRNFPNNLKNKQSVFQLMTGFFKFFSTFDFHLFVLCPLDGKAYPRNVFINEILPKQKLYQDKTSDSEFKPFKMNGTICIQDPFVYNLNPGQSFTKNMFNNLRPRVSYAAHLLQSNNESNQKSSANILLDLYFTNPIATLPKIIPTVTGEPNDISLDNMLPQHKNHINPNSTDLLILQKLMSNSEIDPDKMIADMELRKLWIEKCQEFLLDIIRCLFGVEIYSTDKHRFLSKQQKIDENSDVHTINTKSISLNFYELNGKLNLFLHRKFRKYITSMSPIEYIKVEKECSENYKKFGYNINYKACMELLTDNEYKTLTIKWFDLIGKGKTKKNSFHSFHSMFDSIGLKFLPIYFKTLTPIKSNEMITSVEKPASVSSVNSNSDDQLLSESDFN